MVNRLFQGMINQMKGAVTRPCGVVDTTGLVVASSESSGLGTKFGAEGVSFINAERFVFSGRSFHALSHVRGYEFAAFVEGEDDIAGQFAAIVAAALDSIKSYYDEKYDKGNFIKNVVLNNI
ncbi:MAG: PucR family transcriptional regulator, partial [Oscillospiraceae bacterium]|nr:PucR family transcriptional regulator [Oscillospiraceae bacterium]